MTATVRIYAHSAVVSVPVANQNLASSDAAFVLLKQPYLGREVLEADSGSSVESDPSNAPDNTACLLVEVQTGKEIAYEVTPQNATLRDADSDSPRLTGSKVIHFGPGSRLSVIDVTPA